MVGSVGFLVDAGLLALLVHVLGVGPFIARIPSFCCATIVTWWLNRRFVFADREHYSAARQYRRYFLAHEAGALTNFAIYGLAIATFSWFATWPVAALALGAGFALVVNYGLAYLYVFPGVPR